MSEHAKADGLRGSGVSRYRIYKAEIGWNVVCPCGSWLEKAMTFEGAVWLFNEMLKGRMC